MDEFGGLLPWVLPERNFVKMPKNPFPLYSGGGQRWVACKTGLPALQCSYIGEVLQ